MTVCPSGWVKGPSNRICYKHIENIQPWNESENSCRSYHGHLAALTSSAELSFAQHLCNECWVGGRSTDTIIGHQWTWSDKSYNWNQTLINVLTPDLKSICTNSSCFYNHNNDSASMCTILTNKTTSLVANTCNISHSSLCMIVTGLKKKKKIPLDFFFLLLVELLILIFPLIFQITDVNICIATRNI